ncbi:MAG: glycosyltransferase family 4 protein [Verrucomicrobiota bacterium]
MKIGFISTVAGHQWPGSEYLWSACAERLLQLQHQVYVSVSADLARAPVLENLRANGARVHPVPPVSGRVSRMRQRFFSPLQPLSKLNLDLLVISSGSAFDPVYWPALGAFLRKTTIPLVFICHFNAETFWVDDRMRGMMSDIFQKARSTVFVSRDNLRITERQLAVAIPRAEIIVPPLCLNLSAPLPWPDRPPDAPWRFACVARLEPRWKGQDVLFEILVDPNWQARNYTLSLFGQGAEADYLRKLSRFYGLEKKVVFAGFAKPADIWREHHLQILAARGEGGPMVITEGMLCGRAAVTTRCGFNPEYVADGETGFLAAAATAECFGAALEAAWDRRLDWEKMGVAAHHAIQNRRSDFNAAERLLSLLLKN